VRTHSATWQVYRDKAAELQERIEAALPPAARAGGRDEESRSVEELVAALLAES
jgi:hypothetical protein